tara:strand:- start:6788 stop:8107 length:1320 start_codon:yes stop_codon:yes gene_type:complete
MADSDLNKIATNIFKELQKTAEKGSKSARKSLYKQVGQILIINEQEFLDNLTKLYPELSGNKSILEKIWKEYSAKARGQEKNVKKRRLNQLKRAAELQNLQKFGDVFYINKYETFRKNVKSTALKEIISKYLSQLNIEDKDRLGLLGGSKAHAGQQMGHGDERTGGLPVSTLRATKTKQLLEKLPSGATKAKIGKVVATYEEAMRVEIAHEQVLTPKGNLSKKYIPILIMQDSWTNLEMSKFEQAAIDQLEKELKDLATLEASTSLGDAIGMVTFSSLADKIVKMPGVKLKGTRKKSIKEKGKGEKRGKFKRKVEEVKITDNAPPKVRRPPHKGVSQSPLVLLSILNRQLPDTVRKNMHQPRLVNRTGRFAKSVEAVDMNMTPQGFPSVGYTYNRDIYQTFEVGNRQGSIDRDPRTLIDMSIREIAARYAVGRLYTRRV